MLADTVFESPTSPGSLAILGLLLVGCIYLLQDASSFPVVNPKHGWEIRFKNAQKRFFNDSRNFIQAGLAKVCPYPSFSLLCL